MHEKYIELVKKLIFETSEAIQEKEKFRPTVMVNLLRIVWSCSLDVCFQKKNVLWRNYVCLGLQ